MFSEYVAPVVALTLLGAGMIWFCEQRAKRYQPEDKSMDHQQLHTLMSCAPDIRLTSAQAGELIAEFNRIKMHLNDAMDRNAQLHVEAEQAKRVANDEAQLAAKLQREIELLLPMHVDSVRFIWESRGFGCCSEMAEKFDALETQAVTSKAAIDVLAERQRQVSAEGWTPEHDDQHKTNQLAGAAACYAMHVQDRAWVFDDKPESYRNEAADFDWPWDDKWWKPDSPRRDLVKAGALILAEIERLDRAGGE